MAKAGTSRFKRRTFLKWTGAAIAAGAATAGGIHLFHFRYDGTDPDPRPRTTPTLGSWEDLYRQRWTWDDVKKGSHGWVNCRSACDWDLYVKNGIVVREEQSRDVHAVRARRAGFQSARLPEGRLLHGGDVRPEPHHHADEARRRARQLGQWEQISWDQAISEIAEKLVAVARNTEPTRSTRTWALTSIRAPRPSGASEFQMKAGGVFADNWAEIGDLNFGGLLTLGVAHVGGSSDEWFLSDYLVVWMMNPSVTQISDAHFLYEARYNGTELVVIDPQYTATAIHADQWVPLRTGTDAALGLCTARHIWNSGAIDIPYVREQTDLPFLVRLDTGRFLRESHLVEGGNAKLLQIWNPNDRPAGSRPGLRRQRQGAAHRRGIRPAHRRHVLGEP